MISKIRIKPLINWIDSSIQTESGSSYTEKKNHITKGNLKVKRLKNKMTFCQ